MKASLRFKRLLGLIAAVAVAGPLLMVAAPSLASPAVCGVYVGGDFYPPITNASAAKASGFNTMFLFTLHFQPNGDVYYNDTLVVSNGIYVGDPTWGASLATLRPAINRIELVIASYGDPSFAYIQNLVATNGTGPGSILYQDFLALKNATGVDAIQYDDEQTYDVSSSVELGSMIAGLGMKVTFVPYTRQDYWTAVKSQLGTNVDAIYLQCYDGGAGNDPAQWNAAFGGFKVYPGLWGNTSDAPTVTSKMRSWQQTLRMNGGFMWLNGGLPNDAAKWAQALIYGLEPLNGLVAEDFATNYSATGFGGNEGFGLGPWTLNTPGGGAYISGDNPALFGIWNSAANGQSTAVRLLNSPLTSGQVLLVQLQMNTLDTGNTNAFQLLDAGGNVLFSYFHQGGDNADGHYADATGTHTATGFAYNYAQVNNFQFTLTSSASYTFTDLSTANSISGTLSGAAISQVSFLRANGGSGTVNNGNDFKFNGLVIYAPTNLPVSLTTASPGMTVNFSATPCLTYRVQHATQITGPWSNLGSVFSQFNQSSFTDTTTPAGSAFYRIVTP